MTMKKNKSTLKEDVFSMFEKEEDIEDLEGLEDEPPDFEVEYTPDEIKQKAEEMGIDFDEYDPEQIVKGTIHELEHMDVTDGDLEKTIMIAMAHIEEIPIYYDLLEKMEDEYFEGVDEENLEGIEIPDEEDFEDKE